MYVKNWDDSIHQMPDQLTRQDRAKYDGMRLLSINAKTKSGTIRSQDGRSTYHVTTESCSCPDFRERGLPCKHMYLLDDALTPSSKNKTVALVLAIVLGYLGIHRFYAGKVGTGILWFFTGGIFFVGWIVDICKIAGNKFADGKGRLITGRSE